MISAALIVLPFITSAVSVHLRTASWARSPEQELAVEHARATNASNEKFIDMEHGETVLNETSNSTSNETGNASSNASTNLSIAVQDLIVRGETLTSNRSVNLRTVVDQSQQLKDDPEVNEAAMCPDPIEGLKPVTEICDKMITEVALATLKLIKSCAEASIEYPAIIYTSKDKQYLSWDDICATEDCKTARFCHQQVTKRVEITDEKAKYKKTAMSVNELTYEVARWLFRNEVAEDWGNRKPVKTTDANGKEVYKVPGLPKNKWTPRYDEPMLLKNDCPAYKIPLMKPEYSKRDWTTRSKTRKETYEHLIAKLDKMMDIKKKQRPVMFDDKLKMINPTSKKPVNECGECIDENGEVNFDENAC